MSRFKLRVRGIGAPGPSITAAADLTGAAYRIGAELTATPPSVSPSDAVITGPAWYYDDGTPVPGASGSTYTPVLADLGLLIYAQYSVTAFSVTIPAITPTVGPITEAVAPAPAVANQSLVFGRLTYEGYGGAGVVNTSGAISQDCAINSGTNANHWTLNPTTGVFTPSAAGYAAGLSASYTLGCTFGNATGTDTATITITTEADTYSVATMAEFMVIQAIAIATISGKTIKMRPGDYRWSDTRTLAPFRNKYFTSQVTVTSHDTSSVSTYARFFIQRGLGATNNQCYLDSPTNLRFYRVAFWAPWDYGNHANSLAGGSALVVAGTINGLVFQECDIAANWKELVDTYGFPTLYSGGLGSTSYTCRGIIGNSTGGLASGAGWQMVNNTVRGSWRCLNLFGRVDMVGNDISDFSGDAVNFAGNSSNCIVAWNYGHSPLSTTAEANHRDYLQFLPGARVTGGRIYGNRLNASRTDDYADYPGIARDVQGHFMEDVTPFNYVNFWVFGNWGLTQAVHGVSLYNGENCRVMGNTYAINPSWSTNTSTYPTVRLLRQGASDTSTNNVLADNASNANTSQVALTNTVTNNQVVNPTLGYSVAFDGPSFTAPETLADVQAAWTAKAGTSLLTSVPKISAIGTGYFDYDNRRWDYPRLNTLTAFSFTDLTGQATSTLVTSAAVQILGIVRTQTLVSDATGAISFVETPSVNGALVSLSGGTSPQFRITSNADGSGVVTDWTSTPAIIQSNQYLWVRDTSSASAATTTTVTVQVAQTTDSWTVTTA